MENTSNKFIPVMVILLIVSAFLIGSLYTQVNFLKKGSTIVAGNTGNDKNVGQVAGTVGGNNVPVEPSPGPVDINIKDVISLGNPSAKIALVEFTDYQCPFCGRLFTDTFPQIKKEYIDTGKIKYFVMDFPLTQIHPLAQKSAEASHCALEQNKFWEYHDKLFNNQTALDADSLKKYALETGLNTDQFNTCLDSGKFAGKVDAYQKLGQGYGVRGTPASFVGALEGDTVKQAVEISGAQPYDNFKTTIEDALKKV